MIMKPSNKANRISEDTKMKNTELNLTQLETVTGGRKPMGFDEELHFAKQFLNCSFLIIPTPLKQSHGLHYRDFVKNYDFLLPFLLSRLYNI